MPLTVKRFGHNLLEKLGPHDRQSPLHKVTKTPCGHTESRELHPARAVLLYLDWLDFRGRLVGLQVVWSSSIHHLLPQSIKWIQEWIGCQAYHVHRRQTLHTQSGPYWISRLCTTD